MVNKFHEKLNRCYSQSVLPAPPPHYHQRNPNRIIPALAPKTVHDSPPRVRRPLEKRRAVEKTPQIVPQFQHQSAKNTVAIATPNYLTRICTLFLTNLMRLSKHTAAHTTTALCTLTIRIQTKGLANDFIRRETRTKEGRKWLAPTYLWHAL